MPSVRLLSEHPSRVQSSGFDRKTDVRKPRIDKAAFQTSEANVPPIGGANDAYLRNCIEGIAFL
ncbi:MAG: hypothetical protein ACRD8A_11010 [Candidatus Acidiferrales bacterium]